MGKPRTNAVAYLRTSSAANVGADKDSDKRQRAAIQGYARRGGYEPHFSCPSRWLSRVYVRITRSKCKGIQLRMGPARPAPTDLHPDSDHRLPCGSLGWSTRRGPLSASSGTFFCSLKGKPPREQGLNRSGPRRPRLPSLSKLGGTGRAATHAREDPAKEFLGEATRPAKINSLTKARVARRRTGHVVPASPEIHEDRDTLSGKRTRPAKPTLLKVSATGNQNIP